MKMFLIGDHFMWKGESKVKPFLPYLESDVAGNSEKGGKYKDYESFLGLSN
jgi:hypothetical protein